MALGKIFGSMYRVNPGHVNSFVLDSGEGGLVLVDTGTPADAGGILDAIDELGREPADVRHILVTHCHVDHAGGRAEIKRATAVPSKAT